MIRPMVPRGPRGHFEKLTMAEKVRIVHTWMEDAGRVSRDPVGFLKEKGEMLLFFKKWGLSALDLFFGPGLNREVLRKLGFSDREIEVIDSEENRFTPGLE
jgi:hypothetical protein